MVFPALLLLLLVLSMPEVDEKASLGLINLSSGTWATYGELDGFAISPPEDEVEKYVFNKLMAVALYGRLGQYGYHVGLPWQWTVKSLREDSENRVDPGDLTAYLSRRWGAFDARLGFVMPAGYDTRDGDPWIGQGNRQLLLGAGARKDLPALGVEGILDVEGAYSLDNGIAKKGSWSLSPVLKFKKPLGPDMNSELYFSGSYKSYLWKEGAPLSRFLGSSEGRANRNAGLVPGIAWETRLSPRIWVGAKGGHSLWGYRDKASYHASVFLNYYP